MASEIVIDCATGKETVQPDTFLAVKPVAEPEPVALNPNQPLIDAITTSTDYTSLKANMLTVLEPTSGPTATISLAQPAPATV